MYSINKTSWTEVHIWKISANSLLLMTTWFQQWFSECSVFFIFLSEERNHNVSFEYLDWYSTQMKRTSETNNKKKQCKTKCIV